MSDVHVVIIGNGIAGNAAAFGIRKYDQSCRITIISGENCPEYDPGALPYYVGGDVPRRVVFLRDFDDYQSANIELRLGKKATGVDPKAKQVVLEDGSTVDYDKLVIATGGDQLIPPIKGVDKEGVFCCKVLADADALAQHQGKSAVVIGSGLIGIEAAEALKKKGYEVHLIELMGWIMPRVFDKEPAEQLGAALERNGIKVLTNEKVLSIDGDDKVTGVTTDKRKISCDTVVLATGVAPSSKIVAEAGIEVSKTRGIKVNEYLQTSEEDVFACGDCVESWDAVTGEAALYLLRHNALEQAEVVARNCLGLNAKYRGAWNFTRAHYFDTHAVSIGKTVATMEDTTGVDLIEKQFGDDYYRLILKNGVLAGAQAIGRFADQMGIFLGALRRKVNIKELSSQIEQITRLNSTYPWTYRVIARYLKI